MFKRMNGALLAQRSAIALAVGLALTAGSAQAQTNVTGNIVGQVDAAAGSSVIIENTATGLKRTLTPDSMGRFFFTQLPVGTYKVTLMRDGKVSAVRENVEVSVGQGANVAFASTQLLETVQVVGRTKAIDVTSSNNGSTFSAKQLDTLPVGRTVDSIIQLAPNTTRADSRYAGGASIGGGGPSENAYYINGFPVTNALTQLGSSELPFGAIAQAQILTGGFGAEFGRSVGGVVNIITKSGGNSWEAGVSASVTPNGLRARSRDIYYPKTGTPDNASTDGTLLFRNTGNTNSSSTAGAYVGGPLIKDKLFFFFAGEQVNQKTGQTNVGYDPTDPAPSNGWIKNSNTTNRYLGKFDFNITDDHRLELTLLGDRPSRDSVISGYDYKTGTHDNVPVVSAHYTNNDANNSSVGAVTRIFKYTGNLTNDLTVFALVGKSKTKQITTYDGFDVNAFQPSITATAANQAPGLSYPTSAQPLGTARIQNPNSGNEIKSMRFDLEYQLGSHLLRAGIDDNKLSSTNVGDFQAGGAAILYLRAPGDANGNNRGTTPITLGNVTTTTALGGGKGTDGYYGRYRIFNDVTNAYSDQSAKYLEDRWQYSKNLLLTGGVRIEEYQNKNGDKETFLEMKNQVNPRAAFAWDLEGNGSTKLFGSAGRYAVQIPTHVAIRGASRSTFTDQFFTYTGVDPKTGLPVGRKDLTAPQSQNNEYGQPKLVQTVAALDMKPSSQDEFTLGLERALSDSYTGGAKFTQRKLRSTIDDFCDARPFKKWAADNKVDISKWGGFGCASFNPGEANDFMVNFSGDEKTFTRVHLSKEDLGFEKATRKYTAIDLFVEHPLRNGWYGKVNYTWSTSKGNTEGQTLSDVAQTDVAATQTWDYKEIMQYANGLLPAHRRHQLKAFGFYELSPEWMVGANVLVSSGRPKSCLGALPAKTDGPNYGSAHHYCDGQPSPRGAKGTLPWENRLDMNLQYKPAYVKGLTLRADVFNVFNSQITQTVDEVYQVGSIGSAISPTYGQTLQYTPARSIKLTATYDVKF